MHQRARYSGTARASHGFSLIEILIVVVILGVLTAIVLPQFADATKQSGKSVFVSNLRHYTEAAQLYMFDTGEFPPDSSSGQIPPGFGDYIDEGKWSAGTPIGGVWDLEYQDLGGVQSAIGVHFDGTGMTRDDIYMREIDELVDDGDLSTGNFRKFEDGRYYRIIRE
ncbi:type II secretion system protein [Algisphaera agarilytica]|uniref:Prepilin-type N-terminal cleavage/methylation domain-containing protein n=1 Tax=Algisphaera agarilytica TaxID=1385975 RepID=A0A7X0LJR8_9BACT|nr:type II secretion system protein [Algisphaera agarilytica]MBB6429044.1 prepilin-type N-terminal cleavage/methylation domain-containing protein [Algisphaera agarilytica]